MFLLAFSGGSGRELPTRCATLLAGLKWITCRRRCTCYPTATPDAFPVTGGQRGTINQFKEQLNRLAASRMQIGVWREDRATTISTQPIEAFDIWLPSNLDQRTLWSTTLTLDKRFYETLRQHAFGRRRNQSRCRLQRPGSGFAVRVYCRRATAG